MSHPPLPSSDLDELIASVSDLLPELAGTRILVTGATGFFGTWLVGGLLHLASVTGTDLGVLAVARRASCLKDRLGLLAHSPNLSLCDVDVLHFGLPPGLGATHAIHAATPASARFNASDPIAMARVAAEGTREVLGWCATHGVGHALLTSSGAVYGPQPTELTHLGEDYPGAPNQLLCSEAYAEGKRLAELYAAAYAAQGSLRVSIARCFAFSGPHLPLDAHFAIGNFVRDALQGGPILVRGDGTPQRSYLYASDLVAWLIRILLRGQTGRAYNVGSERDLSVGALARTVGKIAGCRVEIQGSVSPEQAIQRYVPSTHRARTELGTNERISLEDGIERWLAWCRKE